MQQFMSQLWHFLFLRFQTARLDLETILAFYTFSLFYSKAGITTSAFNDLTAVYTLLKTNQVWPPVTHVCVITLKTNKQSNQKCLIWKKYNSST